ncbi:lipopolysaccharide biosynthesis protein [Pusillimonas sp. ANT_WB101]|uniref:lipopolysaccharide biosynthesis protein n=1 Tax=Pusillimonas sp. ANT_WB101 TaxID=2597356 RepID=UPI00165DA673|nr:oligosaccharide flippase family protein [Pusillimonas sp. ANT_WB101]
MSLLVGGTAAAQLLNVLSLPFLTRLYSPSEFGILAIYVSIINIVASVACLRLEIAIPIPRHDREAARLLVISILSALSICLLTAAIVFIFKSEIDLLLGKQALEKYYWLIPIGIMGNSLYASFQYWTTRKKRFTLIAKTKVVQAVGSIGTQILLAGLGFNSFGLLIGYVVSSSAGFVSLSRETRNQEKNKFRNIRPRALLHTLKKYQRFPKYSTLEALGNSTALQVPILMIASLSLGPEVGYLMLATRVMAAPMTLIGRAVGQVYLSRAPDEFREGTLHTFTNTILSGLVKTGVGPLIFAGIVSPYIFPLVFGSSWQRAGEIVSWMTPWFVMQFITSPISMTLHVLNRQRSALVLQMLGLAMRVGSVLLAASIAKPYVIEAYAISGFVFYSIYFLVVVLSADLEIKDALKALGKGFPIILAWGGLGVLSILILRHF